MVMRTVIVLVAAATACSPTSEVRDNNPTAVVSVGTALPSTRVLAPEAAPPFSARGELGKVVTVAASKSSPQVDARALVWRARPDETFNIAVRHGPPVPQQAEKRAFGDSDAYIDKLEVEVVGPDGKKQTVSTRFAPGRTPKSVNFWPGRTLMLEIGAGAVRVRWPTPAVGQWATPLERTQNGVHLVGVTSHIVRPTVGDTLVLRSGRVRFDVQPHHPSRRDLMAAAEPERVKAGALDKQDARVEGGFVANTLLQLDDDRWVARFAKPAIFAFQLTSVFMAPNGKLLNVETQDINTCVAESMRIDTPSGPRAIETLEVGDAVWGWSQAQHRKVVTTVKGVVSYPRRPTVWLGDLQVSPTHPVWDGRDWRAAGELSEAKPGAEATVFALTVGEPHTYFAEGRLVHNKDRMYSDKLDDPWVFMWNPQEEWWK